MSVFSTGSHPNRMVIRERPFGRQAVTHNEGLHDPVKLYRDLRVTRQTLYWHVGPDGSLRRDGQRLLDGK